MQNLTHFNDMIKLWAPKIKTDGNSYVDFFTVVALLVMFLLQAFKLQWNNLPS